MTGEEIRTRVDAWIDQRWLGGDLAALADQWACVADRYGPESAPALGVLTALVRAAWGRDVFAAADRGDGIWRVYQAHREYVIGMGPAEGDALVSALECSPVEVGRFDG